MSSYLELLNLTREPFSNSPDPDAYYRTPTHEDCLNRLEGAYGSVPDYLRAAGLSKEQLDRLRRRLLEE